MSPHLLHRHAGAALAALALLLTAAAPLGAQSREAPLGVVSLRVTHQPADAQAPWNKQTESTKRGNAVVVGNGQLLTTADMIKNATLIEARKLGRYPDYPARVERVDHELDLALLSVADAAFWNRLSPIPLSEEPVTYSRFIINRWRTNGRFERGTGEVVDLRVSTSRFGATEMPVMRGSTNMSGLGWAEVMTLRGQVVGLITSHDGNELQATPSPLLARFLRAARESPYRGFAQRGFTWQKLDHPALRRHHELDAQDAPGILVNRVLAGGTGAERLQPGDVLLEIGDYTIDAEGRIEHPLYGSLRFSLAINDTLAPTVPARILRDGEERTLELPRRRFGDEDYRVLPYRFGEQPDYLVFGGLVLQELGLDYLRSWGRNWSDRAPGRLVIEYALNAVREADSPADKVVIVSKVLPDRVNLGFADIGNAILTHANGRRLTSLDAFREALQHPRDGYHVIRVLPGQGRRQLVFPAGRMPEANRRISRRYGVPAGPLFPAPAEAQAASG